MYVDTRFTWESRAFVLYLLVVLTISLLKALSIAQQLWWFAAKQSAPQDSGIDDAKADSLAASAMSHRFPHNPAANVLSGTQTQDEPGVGSYLRILRQADMRFHYSWELCAAKVASLKRTVRLTLLASVLLLVFGAVEMAKDVAQAKRVMLGSLGANAAEKFWLLGFGILACTILYALSSFLEGALARRMARWRYFLATATGSHG